VPTTSAPSAGAETTPTTAAASHEPGSEPTTAPPPAPPKAKAAPATLRTGTVEVSGDMVSAVLISPTGRRRSPGTVPVGTYDLEVAFANGKTVTRNDMVVVTANATVTIRCSSRVENCR
jgi:hypothetical protein